jgi:hypothetical protein
MIDVDDGAGIRELRLAQRVPIKDLATRLPPGFSEFTIYRIESGRRPTTPVEREGIVAAIFGRVTPSLPCNRCGDERRNSQGDLYPKARGKWVGYCRPCAQDARQAVRVAARSEAARHARADRICANCGTTFTGSRSDAVYCSIACRNVAAQRRHRARRLEQPCDCCGVAFTPARSDVRYCSTQCRNRASNMRRRHPDREARTT